MFIQVVLHALVSADRIRRSLSIPTVNYSVASVPAKPPAQLEIEAAKNSYLLSLQSYLVHLRKVCFYNFLI